MIGAASRPSTTSATSRGKRVLVRTDFNVPIEDGHDHRRLPHPRRAADDRLAARARRDGGVRAATSAGRRARRTRSTRWSPSGAPGRAGAGRRAAGEPPLRPGRGGQRPEFVGRLVDGIDAYVNDAFGASHRAHASIVGPPQTLPSAMGLLLQKEVDVLLGLRNDPKRPFVAVLGGAKISDKLGVVEALLDVVDALVIGGAMCFTFLAAQGKPIGDSLFEPDQVDTCRRLLAQRARRSTCRRTSSASTPPATRDVRDPAARRREGLRHRPRYGGRVQRRRSWRRGPSSGTGRWGCSKTSASRPARARSRRRWPTRRRSPSSAAATPPPRSPQFGLDDDVDHVSHRRRSVARAARARRPPGPRRTAEAPNAHG